MKICKVRPNHNQCCACLDIQISNNSVLDCEKCGLGNKTYELLQIGTGFWSGDYAMVQNDGKLEKVALSRIYDVKETKGESYHEK